MKNKPSSPGQARAKAGDPQRRILEAALQAQTEDRPFDAIGHYLEALRITPGNYGILFNLGILYFATQQYDAAIKALQQSNSYKAGNAQLLKILGASFMRQDNTREAEPCLAQARTIAPADDDIRNLLLECYSKNMKYREILALLEEFGDAPYPDISYYGYEMEALISQRQPEKALTRIMAASEKDPGNPAYLPLLGKIYNTLRQFDKELEVTKKAYEADPSNPRMASNYGQTLMFMHRNEDAIAIFDKAYEADPSLYPILVNKAQALRNLKRMDDAIAVYRQALALNPTSPPVHFGLGGTLIALERYREGWPHCEWYWHVAEREKFRPRNVRQWWGEDLTRKKLLLFADQGIGDTVLFSRYIPLLQEKYPGLEITVLCEAKLIPLLQNSLAGQISFTSLEDAANGGQALTADFMAPFGALPGAFETTIDSVPAPLRLRPSRTLDYKRSPDDIVIGVSWHTNSIDMGYKRSLQLTDFLFLRDIPGIRIIDLQYGDTASQRSEAADQGLEVFHDDTLDAWTSLQDHIDQIAACDLVISIDNTTVHAAASVGVPVWTLLPYDSYWRWHLNHESTPWYPSMRLLRQRPDRDFAPVLERARQLVVSLRQGDRSVLLPPPFTPSWTEPQKPEKTAILLNDTSTWYHWGCTGTSTALQNNIRARGYALEIAPHLEIAGTPYPPPQLADFDSAAYLSEYRFRNPTLFSAISAADRVIINGEGTIHGLAPNALRLMYLAYVAKTVFGKQVHIINHACFPEDSDQLTDPRILAFYLKTYRAVDDIVVRDKISHNLLTMMGIENRLGFDSLPLTAREWLKDKPAPVRRKHVILAGSSLFSARSGPSFRKVLTDLHDEGYTISILIGAALHKAAEDKPFCDFIQGLMGDHVQVHEAKSFDEWMTTLNEAALLISGRFHYSIAAACLGTPFVAFEGNTPKLHALCDLLQQPAPLPYAAEDLTPQLVLRTHKTLAAGPLEKDDRDRRLNELCGLALHNFDKI